MHTVEYYSAFKWIPALCNKSWRYFAKRNKPVTEGQVLHNSNIYELSKIIKITETNNRIVRLTGIGKRDMGGLLMNGCKISAMQDE